MKNRNHRSLALSALILPAALLGCGTEKMNETESRGGTRVNDVAPATDQPGIGASEPIGGLKEQTGPDNKPAANSSTPYGGGGAGVAPPVSPAPGAEASGDSNSGQTSGAKSGAGSDATTEGAKPNPGATGPGTGKPPQ